MESDCALDYVDEFSNELIEAIWTLLHSEESPEADEAEYCELFTRLEWLFAVENAGAFNGWKLPPVAQVEPVLDRWFVAWADYFDGLSGPEFKAERGAVIETTFDRFKAICAKYEADRQP